jgi:hypothetical protein
LKFSPAIEDHLASGFACSPEAASGQICRSFLLGRRHPIEMSTRISGLGNAFKRAAVQRDSGGTAAVKHIHFKKAG